MSTVGVDRKEEQPDLGGLEDAVVNLAIGPIREVDRITGVEDPWSLAGFASGNEQGRLAGIGIIVALDHGNRGLRRRKRRLLDVAVFMPAPAALAARNVAKLLEAARR